MVTAKEILATEDRPLVELKVPEWGCSVWLRPLDAGTAMEAFEAFQKTAEGKERVKAGIEHMLIRVLCDEDGRALFTKEDVPALLKKNMKVIQRLITEATKLSAMTEEGQKKIEKK